MRVRTIKQHTNPHPPQYVKNIGRKYDLADSEARMLIEAALVEEDSADQEAGDD